MPSPKCEIVTFPHGYRSDKNISLGKKVLAIVLPQLFVKLKNLKKPIDLKVCDA